MSDTHCKQRRFFIGANWKMNWTEQVHTSICSALSQRCQQDSPLVNLLQIVIAPPFPFLSRMSADLAAITSCSCSPSSPSSCSSTSCTLKTDSKILLQLGAQNVHEKPSGAYTGEVSADMLVACGVHWVIVGHSERRSLYHEDDQVVALKMLAARQAGLGVVVCIGEQLSERTENITMQVLDRQLSALLPHLSSITRSPDDAVNIVIAYEPVWAIGTGLSATPEQVQETHSQIRQWLQNHNVSDHVRIIYGGSVNAANASSLVPIVDGFLVGGASLKAAEFSRLSLIS